MKRRYPVYLTLNVTRTSPKRPVTSGVSVKKVLDSLREIGAIDG